MPAQPVVQQVVLECRLPGECRCSGDPQWLRLGSRLGVCIVCGGVERVPVVFGRAPGMPSLGTEAEAQYALEQQT